MIAPPTPGATHVASPPRPQLRAGLFLDVVLPLLEVVARERLGGERAAGRGTVQIEVEGTSLAARLRFEAGSLVVESGAREGADQRWIFADVTALNAFFSGRPVLPRVRPWGGLGRPLLLVRTVEMLTALRLLEPPRTLPPPAERALRVRLILRLITRSLGWLHRAGWEPIRALTARSPERVYQWTVQGSDVAAYVRMHEGKLQVGAGTYARRRPFVHFVFPGLDAAFEVFTATGSQMSGFRGGQVQTDGSPEYTRRMALLMQQVDQLLTEG